MKKIKNLSIIFIIFVLIITFLSPIVLSFGDLGLGDKNSYKGDNPNSQKLVGKANNILGIIQVVGVVVSVVVLVATGIRYMFTSVEERAEYKHTFILYLVGAFLVFAGTTLPQLIYTFAQDI